jgi:hypothetical protein
MCRCTSLHIQKFQNQNQNQECVRLPYLLFLQICQACLVLVQPPDRQVMFLHLAGPGGALVAVASPCDFSADLLDFPLDVSELSAPFCSYRPQFFQQGRRRRHPLGQRHGPFVHLEEGGHDGVPVVR